MHIVEGISIGISAIRSNKLRSLLTILGIVIGVAAVLAMIAIGDGAKQIVLDDAQKMGGINQFALYRSDWTRLGNRWVPNRSKEYFTYEDVMAIEAECPSVKGTIPRVPQWGNVRVQASDGAESRTSFIGVNEAFAEVMGWELQEGRFLTGKDVNNKTKVCVLGHDIALQFFRDKPVVGQEIKIAISRDQWGKEKQRRKIERFRVVGTMAFRGRSLGFGWNLDEFVYLPLTTAQQRFIGDDEIRAFSVLAHTVEDVPKAMEETKAVIRKRHSNRDDFFSMWDMRQGVAELEKIRKIIKIALGSIAGFSLLVGGIGIMNMMLVAVNERTREIGLRKAVGAKSSDILLQFLTESVLMCAIGGAIGIGLGILAGEGMAMLAVKIVKIVPEWPAVISWQWMLISVSVSAIIGISFGLYPAIKASTLPPIEALRKD